MVFGFLWFANLLAFTRTVCSVKVYDARSQVISRGVQNGIAYASFKAHKFAYLNIGSLATTDVLNGSECGGACLSIPSCFSFNLAAVVDINGKLLCELLPSDKYNNSDKFIASQNFHHFSIRSPCLSSPCPNSTTCVSLYEKNSYSCICRAGYQGINCQTEISQSITTLAPTQPTTTPAPTTQPSTAEPGFGVTVVTSTVSGAGTDARLLLQLVGTDGTKSGWTEVATEPGGYGHDFEKGMSDYFTVVFQDVGIIGSLEIDLVSIGSWGEGWTVDQFTIEDPGRGMTYTFNGPLDVDPADDSHVLSAT